MNKLIIDIETIPNQNIDDDIKPKFNESTVKLGNVKDQEKINAKIESSKKEFESGLTKRMSIESNYCQIISLGYIEVNEQNNEVSRGVLFDELNDKSIIEQFDKIYTGQTIIGWNSKNFDIPIIWKRAILNNTKNPVYNYQYLCNPYNDNSIDLMRTWNGSTNYGKMSDCAKLLGIECKTGLDGSMIYDAYKDKKFDEIKAYNLEDCQCTLDIYKRIY